MSIPAACGTGNAEYSMGLKNLDSGSQTVTDWCNAQPIRRWIESVDEVAERHLPLFKAALDALLAPRPAQQNLELSQACERWRVQLLRHDPDQIGCTQQALIDILDVAANKLAARPPRSPRRIKWAVAPASPTIVDGRGVYEWLGSNESKRALIRLATRLTDSNACVPADRDTTSGRRRVALFAPIYLSNFCVNSCPYCWFRFSERIVRRHLTVEEVCHEADALASQGVRDVLLVAGDYPKLITTSYLTECVRAIRVSGLTVRIEVAPLNTWDYLELAKAGVHGVTTYQETYDRGLYAYYHPKGRKAAYVWRLETLDRAADVGVKNLGLGILLGLADPLQDIAGLIEHGRYLATRFPEARLAFSLPRIHNAPADFKILHRVADETLIHLYSLLRVAFPTCDLVLSTREKARLRNRLVKICITRLSAGSRTSPGAYAAVNEAGPAGTQFPVADLRPVSEVRGWLLDHGYAVC